MGGNLYLIFFTSDSNDNDDDGDDDDDGVYREEPWAITLASVIIFGHIHEQENSIRTTLATKNISGVWSTRTEDKSSSESTRLLMSFASS